MDKLTVGRKRNKKETETPYTVDHSFEGRIMFSLGLVVMCLMLIIPLTKADGGEKSFGEEAVAVISGAVESDPPEKLVKPDRDASAEERWSVYDYIGQMIAELIFGEG